MIKKILEFFTPTCGQCKVVQKMLEDKGIEYQKIDCTTDINEGLINRYKIGHVPVVIVVYKDKSIKRLDNIPEVKEWLAHQ